MPRTSSAIVGAAEIVDASGRLPQFSQISLQAEAAIRAMKDAGLSPKDVDGIACVGNPAEVAWYIGMDPPNYVDGTSVGGCSFMLHVRHAVAAVEAGLAKTIVVTHGESGRSQLGRGGFGGGKSTLNAQFEGWTGVSGPPSMFTLPVMRYMKETGTTEEQLASVAVAQREWAGMNPNAVMKDPITIDDVLNSRQIAWPFRLLMCCLVTDGAGALIVTSADRAKDFPQKPVYIIGTGESVETPMVSQMKDLTRSGAFKVAGPTAFAEAGITHSDVDHLMIYDAFAHLPIYGLEDLGFVGRGEAGAFIAAGNTRPGGKLPLNTNGGGLSYTHSGMYGMYALQESVRQVRGTAPAQVDGVKVSVSHGVGGMFMASGTIIMSNERPS